MNSDIFAKLKSLFPHLDWATESYPNHAEFRGMDGDTLIIHLTLWNSNAGYHAGRVDLQVLGAWAEQYLSINSALEWLGWFQGVVSK
jgi:hypothetical protein